jgi:hypothetical protein
MNRSVTYSEALSIVSSPESISEGQKLFMEVAPVMALNIFVPLVIFMAVTMVWSIYRDHRYKKLWNNDDFWIAVLILTISMIGVFVMSPYLFIYLV